MQVFCKRQRAYPVRTRHWNSWNLVHGFPKVEYVDGEKVVTVHYAGLRRTLDASLTLSRQHSSLPDRLKVQGFAARFPKGRKVWNAQLYFVREKGSTEWEFYEVYLFFGPLSSEPPDIVGFLEDYPARDRGATGMNRDFVLDRARAGRPDGPKNAREVGDWWGKRPSPYL